VKWFLATMAGAVAVFAALRKWFSNPDD